MSGMDVSVYTGSGCNSVDGEAVDPTIITNFADSGETHIYSCLTAF